MTATDELRRMLDERGVEWEDESPVPSMKPWKTSFMSFTGEEVTLSCYDEPKWIMGTLVFHTPQQAIEATLGRGTCEMQRFESGTNMTRFGWRCTECGMATIGFGRPNYCSNCGAKVVD